MCPRRCMPRLGDMVGAKPTYLGGLSRYRLWALVYKLVRPILCIIPLFLVVISQNSRDPSGIGSNYSKSWASRL